MTKYLVFLAICAFAALAAGPVDAEEAAGREVTATAVTGTVEFSKAGTGEWAKVSEGAVLQQYDVVRTGENSTCSLLFHGMSNSDVVVKPNSVLALTTVSQGAGDDTELGLSLGAVLVKAEQLKGESQFEVRTPNSIVGIRGTEFEVTVD